MYYELRKGYDKHLASAKNYGIGRALPMVSGPLDECASYGKHNGCMLVTNDPGGRPPLISIASCRPLIY